MTNQYSVPDGMKKEEWKNMSQEMIGCIERLDKNKCQQILGYTCPLSEEEKKNLDITMKEAEDRFFEIYSQNFYAIKTLLQ